MKRRGYAIVVLGGFILGMGVLSRVYIYPNVAVVPGTPEIDAVAATAPGDPVTYFDISQLEEVEAPFENRTRIRGNAQTDEKASKDTGKEVVVWDAYACSGVQGENCLDNPLPIAAQRDVVAMDKSTSKVISWDGSYAETGGKRVDSSVIGYVFKLPFNMEKKDYTYWSAALAKQVPLTFEGVGKIQGLTVHKYTQTIEPTKVGTIELPGFLVGSDQLTVAGDRIVSSTSTFDFEPETGVAMTQSSSPDNYVEVNGNRVLTTTQGTLAIDGATITKNVETYRTLATQLKLIRVTVPLVGIPLGLLMIGLGMYIGRRAPRLKTHP